MARKAKATVVSALVANELENIEVLIPEVVAEEEVVEQSTGPSLTSMMAAQIVEVVSHPAAEVEAKTKNEGVGIFIRKLIDEGLGNKAILDIVHEQYGNSNTTYACVAWYRNKMKKAGTVKQVATSLDWLQNFAKANGLSEESTQELGAQLKVA